MNQIAEATGIHRSVVQKALNDPEIIELQETLKIHLRSRYVNAFPVDVSFAPRETQPNEVALDETDSNAEAELNEVEPNQVELSVSEEALLRIREVEALESIATSLENLQSMYETATNNADTVKQKTPIQEKLEEDHNDIAVKVVELRLNASGSKPLSWRRIREELGLKRDEFHKVIRHSEGYRQAVITRIKNLKTREKGWEYSGKLEVLTGIKLTEEELS